MTCTIQKTLIFLNNKQELNRNICFYEILNDNTSCTTILRWVAVVNGQMSNFFSNIIIGENKFFFWQYDDDDYFILDQHT